MVKGVYSIFDVKTGVYNLPYFGFNEGVAVRDFIALRRDPHSTISQFPADFQLFHVADFDDTSGLFTLVSPPACISVPLEV